MGLAVSQPWVSHPGAELSGHTRTSLTNICSDLSQQRTRTETARFSPLLVGQRCSHFRGAANPRPVRATKQGGRSQLHKCLKAATPRPSRARNGKKLSLEGRTGGWRAQEITAILTPHPALLTSSIFHKSVAIISKHYTNTPIAPRSQQQEQKQR